MPRGQLIRKKRIILDPKYKNPVIGKFVARMMEQGKKSISYSSIYRRSGHHRPEGDAARTPSRSSRRPWKT